MRRAGAFSIVLLLIFFPSCQIGGIGTQHERIADIDFTGSVAPNGSFLVFTDWDNGNLARLDLDTQERHLLTRQGYPGFALFSAVSPDSRQIAFGWCENGCAVRLVNSDGSNLRTLFSDPEVGDVLSLAFSPDSEQIAVVLATKNQSISRPVLISSSDGSIEELSLPGKVSGRMVFSPFGRHLAYVAEAGGSDAANSIHIFDLQERQQKSTLSCLDRCRLFGWRSTDALAYVDYIGDEPVIRLQTILAGLPQGEPVSTGIQIDSEHLDTENLNTLGCTQSGDCYYGADSWTNDVFIADIDLDAGEVGRSEKRISRVGFDTSAHFSPDGQRLSYAVGYSREARSMVVGIHSIKTGTDRRFPAEMRRLGGHAFQPHWSADGNSLLAQGRNLQMREGLFKMDPSNGRVRPVSLAPSDSLDSGYLEWPSWGSNGRWYVGLWQSGGPRRIIRQDPGAESATELYQCDTDKKVSHLALSPDEKWLVFVETDFGTRTSALIRMPAGGGEASELVALGAVKLSSYGQAAFALAWTPDSRSILYIPPHDERRRLELWLAPIEGGPEKLLGPLVRAPRAYGLSVHPDGKQIAFTAGEPRHGEVWVARNVGGQR